MWFWCLCSVFLVPAASLSVFTQHLTTFLSVVRLCIYWHVALEIMIVVQVALNPSLMMIRPRSASTAWSVYDWHKNHSTDSSTRRRVAFFSGGGSFSTAIATRIILKISSGWYPRTWYRVGSSKKVRKTPPLTKCCILHWLSLCCVWSKL